MQKYSHLSTQPSHLQYIAIAISALLMIAGSVWALIYAQMPSVPSAGFLGAYGSAVFIFEVISAILLFAHYRQTGLLTFAVLSLAYFWVALLAPVQVFLLTDSLQLYSLYLDATNNDAAWLWIAWHLGFPILITVAMLINSNHPIRVKNILRWATALFVGLMLLAGFIVSATLLSWFELPRLIANGIDFSDQLSLIYGPAVMFCCALALTVVIAKGKFASAIYSWLALAMLAALCESIVTIYSGARFSYGWYAARLLSVISSSAMVVSLLIEIIHLQHKVIRQNLTLKRMATMDELSGLANRRELDERLNAEVQRSMRNRTPLSLIMMDIDHFKRFNDEHGHTVGDLCLKHVATCLQRNILRHTDLAARYGGEEFAILLPNTVEEDAADLAEHIRKTIALSPIMIDNDKMLAVTASFGVACLIPNKSEDAAELLTTADTALYSAKQDGRNCIARPPQSWHASRENLEQTISSNTHYLRDEDTFKQKA